ncbi:MAG: hypothetical protein HC819_21200 [Cyclobacteriaceae bacterium]|nr:hypothetical protein [Cyclobacteriaceae bacterium]
MIPLRNFSNQYYTGDLNFDKFSYQEGTVTTKGLSNIFWYDLSKHAYGDFMELKQQISDAYKNVANEQVPAELGAIYFNGFKLIKLGTYNILFEYTPPGKNAPSSTAVLPIDWK